MGAEESRTKGASLGGVSEAVDQSLEVKEEDSAAEYVAKKLTEVVNEADIQSEKLKSLETSFAKLRVENCNLKYQLSFVSEKVVRLEKHDVHFINTLKDTITLELIEKIRLLEDRLKTLESPDFLSDMQPIGHIVGNQMEKKARDEIISQEETDSNKDLQDFLVYDEDNLCNLSEVTVDEAGRLPEIQGKENDVTMQVNEQVTNLDMILVDEAGDMHAASDEEGILKGLLRGRKVDESDKPDPNMFSSKPPQEPSSAGDSKRRSSNIQSDAEQLAKLTVEEKLVRLVQEISSSICSSNYLSKCTELLEEILGLELTPAMLLKHPSIVKSVENFRYYACHQQGDKSMEELVKLINSRSEACHLKFLELFPSYVEEKEEFLNFFQEQVHCVTECGSEA